MRGHVRKRGQSWCFVLDAGKDPETGKRRQKWRSGFRTRKDAEVALRQALQRADTGHDPLPQEVTVADFIEKRWLPHLAAQDKPRARTRHRYAELLRLHICPVIGGMRVDRVTPGSVQAALDAMTQKGSAPRTVQQARAATSSAFTAAARWGLVQYNVVRATDAPTAHRPDLVVPTAQQLRQLAAAAEGSPWAIPTLLATVTGARRSEVLGLTWEHVDLDEGVVRVASGLQRIDGELRLLPLKTKAAHRHVPLPAFAVERLRRHRAEQAERRLRLGQAWQWPAAGFVCDRGDGAPLDPDAFTHAFGRLARAAGLNGVRLHDARHGVGTALAKSHTPAEVISSFLGHSSTAFTTSTYVHVDRERVERAARGLEEAFGG